MDSLDVTLTALLALRDSDEWLCLGANITKRPFVLVADKLNVVK